MPLVLERSEEIIAAWRDGTASDNPAGPLMSSEYAESEITMRAFDTRIPSSCSGSRTIACC
ncbi:DUF6229 family protein [Sphaerisporangium fuscum]|uniref:DUF6229 family protein n=1 Tax=Sphaerisporangium fuscum TaxID=2835868 RepID=UPI001BDD8315|nr:DUF6229 family protein [Sphaerisporangium fuscum]